MMNEMILPDQENFSLEDFEGLPAEQQSLLVYRMIERLEAYMLTIPPLVTRKIYDWQMGRPFDSQISKRPLSEQLTWFQQSQLLDVACNTVLRSPTMQALMQSCEGADSLPIRVVKTDYSGYYDRVSIAVSDALDFSEWPWVIAHENRHKKHDNDNLIQSKYSLGLRDRILLQRIYEADGHALHTTVAWELREKGYKKSWDFIRSEPRYGAIAEAFENMALSDPESVHDGRASRAAFKALFNTQVRLDSYDTKACKFYRDHDLREEYREAVSYERDPEKVMQMLRDALDSMKDMSYINEYGDTCLRPLYLTDAFIDELLTDKTYREIRKPEIELDVLMLENGYSSVDNNPVI